MIRDITIGQFYPVDSPIHRLDARVKLTLTFLYIITLFMINSFAGYLFVILVLATVIQVSKVPIKFMLKGIKGIIIIILFTAFINLFMTKGEHVLWQWGFLSLTMEGIVLAAKMCIRLVLLIVGSSVLTLTTTPIQLTDGIEFMLRPFKKIGVPAHEIAMMMTIALRFIPTLLDETDKIMKAQQARGADFDSGNLMQKAKSLIPILVPLFISAFRRAEELAMAMEARCYHGDENRTRMNRMQIQKRDYSAFAMGILYLVAILGIRYATNTFGFLI
ncbi:energy-coupling factor transporter transmembrane component T family protein [Anaerotignum propionicum]|uniref:Energy-coupling factor transporter transmembrane protein EcfT n=1 Tax=Anaerotignum propionicum DSM 1682 TaxID=991789 RepID=A0A0X8V8T1_ANAPI|nr:energy-coupling factor transporter transmembrane component T [Anaerotignum propionicum]AMJ40177.1 energy-coupling factor transporter transmembrane protein EcfT [Anaerotignum propionicum DSM 1682]SHF09875.1 energy-coupling factor transport system permease protein [[Clostridium] propionicum DSM 1682] [Anaerotignum propionicum DSM 1682]